MNLIGTFILAFTGEMADIICCQLKIPADPEAAVNEMVAQTSG